MKFHDCALHNETGFKKDWKVLAYRMPHTRCEMKLGLLFLRLAEHGVGANPTSRLAIGGIALGAAKHKQHSCKTTTTWIQRKQLSVKASHAQV